jgi:plastocyanin
MNMKFAYILIALLIVLVGGYFVVSSQNTPVVEEVENTTPEGYHRMPDGTLMRNDAGTEGMGALSEIQDQMVGEDTSDDDTADGETKVFEVRGSNYAFDQKEIRVKKGDTVTINFESTGGLHDWVLDEFGAATEKVQEGGKSSVTFVADKTGSFEYYCSVGSHRLHGMVGKLIVE